MKIHRAITAAIIAVLLCRTLSFHASAMSDDSTQQCITEFCRETKCSNVSVAVCEPEEVRFFGDKDGIYQIGSMTKAFTGLAVQELIDNGLISESDTVSEYIPGFEAYYRSEKVDITINCLMEQKSGYTNSERDYPSADTDMTLPEWAYSISGRELKSRPGEKYAYSNVNFDLLGAVIENVSGISYREYMEKNIFAPLGLHSTSAGMPEDSGRIVKGSRPGYRHVFEYTLPIREASVPAGYMCSDTVDMSRWIRLWLGNEETPASLKSAMEHIKSRLGDEGSYYAGWERFPDGVIGHSGGTPNYSSRIVFSEESGIGVCVLTNINAAASTDSLCDSVFDMVSGKGYPGIRHDVWTIFDIIFSVLSAAEILLLTAVLFIGNRKLLLSADIALILLFTAIMTVFPMIFGADMREIVLVWAPLSVCGGLILMAADIIVISIRYVRVRINDNRNKTGGEQAVDGDS